MGLELKKKYDEEEEGKKKWVMKVDVVSDGPIR